MNTERAKRKLSAILSADVKGYSRLMGEDEIATVRTLKEYRELMSKLIKEYRGRVVDSPGDNVLAEFASVVDALECSIEIQKKLESKNASLPDNRKMEFRMGVNLGDVIEDEDRVYGDGVNIAARIEGLAEPRGICISGSGFEQVRNKLPLGYQYLGEHTVKNIAQPIKVYRILTQPEHAGKIIGEKGPKGTRWRWAAVAVAIILVGGALALWNFYWRASKIEPASKEKMAFPLPDKPSIAVLPFLNVSGDPKEDYFSDGLTEQIITSLSTFQRLLVIARNSTFVYKGKPIKIQKVAEDLGVRYVLEGSVQKSGDRVRITAQLIDALTGHHIWSERYDREVKDIFAFQDEITFKIMQAMKVELTEGEQERHYTKWVTDNLKAFEGNYQGAGFMRRSTKQDNDTARQLFEEAIALDPKYIWPHVLLGWTHFYDARFGWSESPAKSVERAFELAQKALAMDEATEPGHSLLAGIYLVMRQHDKAIAEAERAIALNPNGADAYYGLAAIVGFAGKWDQSVLYSKQAMRLNPFPESMHYLILGRAYFMTGQYDESIATWKKATQASPNFLPAHVFLAACYSSMGRDAEATAAAKEVLRISPKFTIESYAKTLPYKDKVDIEREVSALRKAGVPDNPPLPLPDKPSIAVLPFTNMSDDPKQEFFADGLAEEIINGLSRIPEIFVIARNSSFTYKGKAVDVKQVAREMGVQYVLEGSVRKEVDHLRITAQLVDALKGHHVFSERFEGEMKNLFALQDEITMKIVGSIQGEMGRGAGIRLRGRGTTNLNAFLKLMELGPVTARGLNRDTNAMMRRVAEEAIALDPGWHGPYTYLAYSYFNDVVFLASSDARASFAKAIQTAQKAISLDERQPRPYCVLCMVYLFMREYDKSIAAAERAVELGPNFGEAYWSLGTTLYHVSRPEEAIPYFQKAMRISPVPDFICLQGLGGSYRMLRRYDDAEATFKRLLQRFPDHIVGLMGLVNVYVETGRMEEAKTEAVEVLRINPQFSMDRYSRMLPFKEQSEVDRLVDALRKAGLK